MANVINRNTFMNIVAKKADTKKQKIDVTIVKRVLKIALDLLATYDIKTISKILK